MDDLIFRAGEVKRLQHTVTADEDFAVTAVTCSIYDADGAALVNGAAGTVDSVVAAEEHAIWYVWDTAGVPAGDYTYELRYTVDSETLAVRGEIAVLPAVSKYDRWIRRISSALLETGVGEDRRQLSPRQWKDALNSALAAYSLGNPRHLTEDVTMRAGTFAYDLPANWATGFSRAERLDYPVDDDSYLDTRLQPHLWRVEEARGVWRFVSWTPAAGETARLFYTAPHVVRDLSGALTVTLAGATGGTFTLTFNGQTTGPIAFDATAAAVKTALEALSNIGSGGVAVTGPAGGPYTIKPSGTLAMLASATLTANGAALTGTTPTVTVASTIVGALDTVPTAHFEGVALYAAGLALLSLSAQAPRKGQPQIGADLVNMRTKEQEYGSRASALMEQGQAMWPHRKSWSVGSSPF